MVLVVDDEYLIRWSVGERLRQEGVPVVEASNGAQARQRMSDDVEVVVLDVKLPDADGLDLLAEFVAAHPGIAVIMITAHGGEDMAETAKGLGAAAFLRKPFDVDQLVGLVLEACSNAQH
ncbi:MAG: response regulator [Myxococcales bacterium]|nr:response regulator [Myxococcales bacterium]